MPAGKSPEQYEAPSLVEDAVEACLADGWTIFRAPKRLLRGTTANQLLLRCGDFFGLPPEVTEDGFRFFVVPDTAGDLLVCSSLPFPPFLPFPPPPEQLLFPSPT